MKKILLNGSPRGDKSNSKVMLRWFNEGYGEDLPIYNLHLERYHKEAKEAFLQADDIFIIMPLYCNSMPAQVMRFFECLEEEKGRLKGKRISVLIHLGFPEATQAYFLKEILEKIFSVLNLECKEVIIRGGSEGTRLIPKGWQRKTVKSIQALGRAFKEDRVFPREAIYYLSNPMVLTRRQKFFMRLGDQLGFSHIYWNKQLKANGALDKSFDKPYIE